jgi:hypothetical protein
MSAGQGCALLQGDSDNLRVVADLSAAEWIAPRLTGRRFGAVTSVVPDGYPAYVRICHPATDKDGNQVGWSEVARATDRQSHPLMQWHALVGSSDPFNFKGSLWVGENPERGNLDPRMLAILCDLLAGHTTAANDCFFCLWGGYGDLENYGWLEGDASKETREIADREQHIFSSNEREGPRLHLPDRDYLVLIGSLSGALRIGWWIGDRSFRHQSPNLFWPADRAWCVASEIDFDSTLVGGSVELVEAIIRHPMLDAWAIEPQDSLAADADKVNIVTL